MMEEMDGRVVYFPPESAYSDFDVLISEVLFLICTSTWRVNNDVSRQEKVVNKRNESIEDTIFHLS